MMHHNLNAFGMGIVVEHLDIEIRIRSDEIEYIKLRMSVPSFNQHLTQSVFGCEIYIFLYFLIVSSMYAMRFALCIICHAQSDRRQVISITPLVLTYNHLPPYTAIFYGMDPRHILISAWFIQIKSQFARQHVTCVVTYHNRTPRCIEWCLNISFHPLGIGCKP